MPKRTAPAILCAILPILIFASSARAQQVSIFNFYKGTTCADYNKPNTIGTINALDLIEWHDYFEGFLNGAAIYSGNNNLTNMTITNMIDYAKAYCKAHPEETITKMLNTLFHSKAGTE